MNTDISKSTQTWRSSIHKPNSGQWLPPEGKAEEQDWGEEQKGF